MGIMVIEGLVFFINIVLLFFYIKVSRRFHWFDQPNELRKIHKEAIPTSAGLIFMAPMVAVFLIFPAWSTPHSFIIGSILLVLLIMGGIDDFKSVSIWLRLLIVCCASAFFLHTLYLPHDINYILLFIYLIGIIWWLNLYNFMDGADGMAIMHAIVTTCGYIFAFTIFEVTNLMALIVLILFLLCLLSFFVFNYPKAKIFMGDSGSFSVSFLLAVFALIGISENIFDQILVISFHLVFIVDATLTLFTRLKYRQKLSQAHSLHLFQALIYDGKSHAAVSMWYALMTFITVVMALYLAFIQVDVYIRLTVLLIEAAVLSMIWYKYHNKTKFERFIT